MQQYLYKATLVVFFVVAITCVYAQQVRLIGPNGQVMATKNMINNSVSFENIPPIGEYKITLWVSDVKKCLIQKASCLTHPNKVDYCNFSGHIVWAESNGEFLEHKSKTLASGKFVCYVERKHNTILVQYYQ
jgi:hypothetical protein